MKRVHVCIEGEECVNVSTLQEACDLLGIDQPYEVVFEELDEHFMVAELYGIGRIIVDNDSSVTQ